MNPYGMGVNMGGMPMNMMGMGVAGGMPNMNMGMNEDEEWLKGFKMGVEEVNKPGSNYDDSNDSGPKINIMFTTTIGTKRNLKFKYGRTISYAIKKYLDSVNKPELFGKNEDVNFLFNANKLDFNDNTPIENKFRNIVMPKIVVNDTKGLIGA